MKQKPILDLDTLAALVVNTAVTDTSSPDPENLRVGWRTDYLLTNCIDGLVVGQYNDPAAYAEIGRQVLFHVRDAGDLNLPDVAALAQLAVFRGERLLPMTQEQEKKVLGMIDSLETDISALPNDGRKLRCQSLLNYHAGVFYDACGLFDQAAEAQRRAADEAAKLGDGPGEAISRFVGMVYCLKQVLCEGKMNPQTIFSTLKERFDQLVKAVRGSDMQVLWGEWNGPVHMVLACVWLNQGHDDWDRWSQAALAAAEKLGKAEQPLARLVRATVLKDSLQAQTVLRAIVDGIGQTADAKLGEVQATALLILARDAWSRGDREGAARYFDQMPAQGARHVQACEVGSS